LSVSADPGSGRPAIVVDAVVHPYNLSPANQNPEALAQLESVHASHCRYTGDPGSPFALTREEFFSDFPFDVLAEALFIESPTDYAFLHSLPNLGFALDYVTDPRRAAAFRDRHPERFGLFATVDTPFTDRAIRQLEEQVREFGVQGLKLYPAFFYDGMASGWRLDGKDFAVPLLEAAYDLGIRNVAVHKALWVPPAPRESFEVGDVDGALERFPDINFEIVHAGMAFLDETIAMMRRHENLFATLESVFSYVLVRPEVFAKVIGEMMAAVGSERLLYASGANLMHPRPVIDAFTRFQLPQELIEAGLPALTERDRRNILGENKLRLHGLDPVAVLAGTAADVFSERGTDLTGAPWSRLRATPAV
jgi:predicted TIM-barrel fold metal-dependent hydrolase